MRCSAPSPWIRVLATAALAVLACVAITIAMSSEIAETSFSTDSGAAMVKMMSAMAIEPSGDVDKDFVAMMIPHHQGAIDMAQAKLRHGGNEQLRRIAQEIIVEQQQEIVAMRLALGQRLPPQAVPPQLSSKEASRPSRGWLDFAASICRSRR